MKKLYAMSYRLTLAIAKFGQARILNTQSITTLVIYLLNID